MKLKKLIYNGFYYPVIGGRSAYWENGMYKIAWLNKLGGYTGWLSWLPVIGLKCIISNTDKPYKQFVIDTIIDHKEMILSKHYFYEDRQDRGFMWTVHTPKGEYIGNIETAYKLSQLRDFKTSGGKETTVCAGWNPETQRAYGWSHRANISFGFGDKIFEENFGDENTPFTQHGRKTIRNYADSMRSAIAFAKSVS